MANMREALLGYQPPQIPGSETTEERLTRFARQQQEGIPLSQKPIRTEEGHLIGQRLVIPDGVSYTLAHLRRHREI